MRRRIKSIKGFFGQLIHYEDSTKVGESWPGLFDGSLSHYDADGRYIGYSDRGMIADMVHYDEHGNHVGSTCTGLFGQKKHYSANGGYVGATCDGITGDTTDITDDTSFFDCQEIPDSFDGEW